MWSTGGYREGVLSQKIAGSTSANKLQEGEIHEYAGFNPSQPVRSNLDKRIHEGMAMLTPRFVSSTLLRICDPDPSSFGSDFSNLCVVMSSLPSTARTYIRLLASSPDDACFCLLVGVVENWIQDMAEKFSKTAAGVSNAHLDFKRAKELKMHTFLADFLKDYNSTGLP